MHINNTRCKNIINLEMTVIDNDDTSIEILWLNNYKINETVYSKYLVFDRNTAMHLNNEHKYLLSLTMIVIS